MAEVAKACGASAEIVAQVLQANTARHFQELMLSYNICGVFDLVCQRARNASQTYAGHQLNVNVLMCDFDGSILGYAGEQDVR